MCRDASTGERGQGMMRKILQGSAMLCMLVWTGPMLAAAQDLPKPEEVIESVVDQSVDALLDNREAIAEDHRVAAGLIDDILGPHVHYELMTRLILGRHVREASDEQIERFIKAFRESTVRTYARMLSDNVDTVVRLIEDNGKVVDIMAAGEPDDRGRVTVRTQVQTDTSPVPVNYRMIATDEGWLVYDVVIENISFVTNYREEYGSEIRRGGIDRLITRLEERNRQAGGN